MICKGHVAHLLGLRGNYESLFQIDHADARRDLSRDLIQGDSGYCIGFARHDRLARIKLDVTIWLRRQ
jgi:hypothetical protein